MKHSENYKGFLIETTNNATDKVSAYFTSLAFLNNEPMFGTFSTPLDKLTSIEKIKIKIDNYLTK